VKTHVATGGATRTTTAAIEIAESPLPAPTNVTAGGATRTTAPAIEIAESPGKSFWARLGAKLKYALEWTLEWMRERLFFFLR